MVRDVGGIVGEDAGAGRTVAQDDNPFEWKQVRQNIIAGLNKAGYSIGIEYEIMKVLLKHCRYQLRSWCRIYIYTA